MLRAVAPLTCALSLGMLLACGEQDTPAEAPAPEPPAEAPAAKAAGAKAPAGQPAAEGAPPPEPAPPTATTDAPAAGTSSKAPSTGGLPDLTQGLEQGSCANGPGNEGADSHFVGVFKLSGDTVTGTERWLLSANPKLQAAPSWGSGPHCEVRWMMTGARTSPLHCGDCDLGLQLTANVDMTGSTCPEDMVKREKTFTVRYDVRRGADGVAWFYFANSGKLLGQGYHAGDELEFVTQHQCKWF